MKANKEWGFFISRRSNLMVIEKREPWSTMYVNFGCRLEINLLQRARRAHRKEGNIGSDRSKRNNEDITPKETMLLCLDTARVHSEYIHWDSLFHTSHCFYNRKAMLCKNQGDMFIHLCSHLARGRTKCPFIL